MLSWQQHSNTLRYCTYCQRGSARLMGRMKDRSGLMSDGDDRLISPDWIDDFLFQQIFTTAFKLFVGQE